jgi:hypothetical protein
MCKIGEVERAGRGNILEKASVEKHVKGEDKPFINVKSAV